MYNDFIALKNLEGELKIVHKKSNWGMTVTTEEFIVQKPHINYLIKLQDIISVIPLDSYPARKKLKFSHGESIGSELAFAAPSSRLYRFYVRQAHIHNRSGIRRIGTSEFVLPVADELLRAISLHGNMSVVVENADGFPRPDLL